MDFLSPEAGQRRRQWLDAKLGGMWEYVPPELRPFVALGNEINPVTGIERAGQDARRVVDPNVQGWDKVQAVGDMASNMAGSVAPMVAASKGAVPAANAVEDALIGWSQAAGVPEFMADEFGGVGFRAYHGSPHDFDRFSLDKIGTGEGAQAYGHGLYFAENEAVAKGYRDNLSLPTGTTARDTAARILDEHGGDYEAALTDIGTRFNRALANGRMEPAEYDRWMKAQRMLMNKDPVLGRMYEVQINADPNDFLDWDKPLSEQPQALEALRPVIGNVSNPGYGVKSAIDDASKYLGYADDPRRAEDLLREAGIPGIRYLDAGSRGAGDGSRNYVVFDDNLIEILRKYGLVPGMIGAGAYGMQPTEAQAGQ